MTTKEQERKALAQIQKIVAGLGENSYVGTALDGALELAEQNIDCDAAFSARYYQDTLFETEKELKAANAKIAGLEKELEEQQEAHENEYEALISRRLSDYAAEEIKKLLAEKTAELQQEVNNAAARIVEAADNPKSAAFANAVNDHRTAKQELEKYGNIMKHVCNISAAKTETAA